MQSATNQNPFERRVLKGCMICALLLLVLGLSFRIAPLFDHGDRMLWQWPTEDGYLMKTIARNIALGQGMTIAAGEIATNGTQPLTTFVWAGIFYLAGGDKATGVLLIQIVQILVSLLAAGLLFILARQLLQEYRWGPAAAALAAGLWFASPVCIDRTMNGLETGNYVLMILLTLLVWLAGERTAKRPFPLYPLGMGVLLGLTFLTRIDAVFFIAAVTGWHVLLGIGHQRLDLQRRLLESVTMGLVSILIASPWLAYNKIVFGSLMPISGTALSSGVAFGSNLVYLPGNLFPYVTLVLPVPSALMTFLPMALVLTLFLLLYAFTAAGLVRQMSRQQISILAIGTLFLLGLAGYFGLFFGASHFMGRYLFPVSPLLAILTVSLGVIAVLKTREKLPKIRWATAIIPFMILTLVVGLNVRIYANKGRGAASSHLQVQQWVEQQVGEEVWVGAVQTGVLGFFHDRTINLDGKVNPYALAAVLESQIPQYVVESPIQYIADWQGVAGWIELDPISEHFELIVNDPHRNLAVLRRTNPVPHEANIRGRW